MPVTFVNYLPTLLSLERLLMQLCPSSMLASVMLTAPNHERQAWECYPQDIPKEDC
jgi:hypothetical protein